MRPLGRTYAHEKGRGRDRYRDRGRYRFRTPIATPTPTPMPISRPDECRIYFRNRRPNTKEKTLNDRRSEYPVLATALALGNNLFPPIRSSWSKEQSLKTPGGVPGKKKQRFEIQGVKRPTIAMADGRAQLSPFREKRSFRSRRPRVEPRALYRQFYSHCGAVGAGANFHEAAE